MSHPTITTDDLDHLVRLTADAASALIGGDVRRYITLIRHADDYTLMSPFGGDPERGFAPTDEVLSDLEHFFQGGEAKQELVQAYTSGDLAVLVVIERQHGRVGGLPDQDLSLRVTLVFRREGAEWWLVHRHADPLVHKVSLEQLAALAQG
jgi:ketosteroid isomerase-like protein